MRPASPKAQGWASESVFYRIRLRLKGFYGMLFGLGSAWGGRWPETILDAWARAASSSVLSACLLVVLTLHALSSRRRRRDCEDSQDVTRAGIMKMAHGCHPAPSNLSSVSHRVARVAASKQCPPYTLSPPSRGLTAYYGHWDHCIFDVSVLGRILAGVLVFTWSMGRRRKLYLGNASIGGRSSRSLRVARAVTSRFHSARSELDRLSRDASVGEDERAARIEELQRRIEAMGGIEKYQQGR